MGSFITIPQLWLIAGILLMLSEFIIPGFVIFFFGLGGIVVAGVTFFCPETTLSMQILIYAIASFLTLVIGRYLLRTTLRGKVSEIDVADADDDGYIGLTATVVEPWEANDKGRILVRDTTWMATSSQSHATGDKVRIIARDNITFIVK